MDDIVPAVDARRRRRGSALDPTRVKFIGQRLILSPIILFLMLKRDWGRPDVLVHQLHEAAFHLFASRNKLKRKIKTQEWRMVGLPQNHLGWLLGQACMLTGRYLQGLQLGVK